MIKWILILSMLCSKDISDGILEAYDSVKDKYPKEEGVIYFLHDQFKDIPYFMNWCEGPHCTRNDIIDTYTMSRLGDKQTIDRVPVIFLKDWCRDSKRYRYKNNSFRTFGWCGEYEMSFCTLLTILGYNCKVYQEINHVTTKIWLDGYEMDVDNTFDTIEMIEISDSYSEWIADYGIGKEKYWYNKTVDESVDKVKDINVDDYFVLRMIYNVKD